MKKVTIRIPVDLYLDLETESKKYGYRSLSAYICKLLQSRQILEIAGGTDLASIMHTIKCMNGKETVGMLERREELCRLYDVLMTEIAAMRDCMKQFTM